MLNSQVSLTQTMIADEPHHSAQPMEDLNALTGGAFAATQSQERVTLLKTWLQTQPTLSDLVRVHRDMSARDKGAAKVLKEAIDLLKREHHQEELVTEWAQKAHHVLTQHPFVMGDALAWIRDAAKAGAPLSKEPLNSLKAQLTDRVKSVEDLQQQCMVQREGVHLLMQRMDNLSARDWPHAQAALAAVQEDVAQAVAAMDQLAQHADWPHVDLRFPPQMEQSRSLLWAAWQAFEAAGQAAQAATDDPQAALPAVPAWAESIQRLRQAGVASDPSPSALAEQKPATAPTKPEPTPEELAQRQAVHAQRLELLSQAVALTHWVPDDQPLAPVAAEVSSMDPLSESSPDPEAAADNPASHSPEAPAADGKPASVSSAAPAIGGHWEAAVPVRQIQQQLRTLREAWKALDHQAPVHHGLWRKFDQACNRAYPFVKHWLDELKEQNQSHMAQRESLITQVEAWTAQLGEAPDWRQVQRDLHQFSEQWRHCGHLNEKAFGQILPRWKAALKAAEAPLHAAQRDNLAERKRLIDEAKVLSEQTPLPIEAIKALQARWQQVSQLMPIDRRLGQKLWEAFRQPIDEAFARNPKPARGAARVGSAPQGQLSAHEQAVMAATQLLEQAVAERDAARIQAAREALHAALRPGAPAVLTQQPTDTPSSSPASDPPDMAPTATDHQAPHGSAPKRLVAVRGDDRHKVERPASEGPRRDRQPGAGRGRDGRDHRDSRDAPRGPRLSDLVFGAQRQALERADKALRALSAQAHGEHLRQLMQCWKDRDVSQLPAAKVLGKGLDANHWQSWRQALSQTARDCEVTSWLRLDMAAGLPTPASDQAARRAYQLQLLTQRHAAAPEQTWPNEVAQVLSSAHTESGEKRLQEALKVLLGRR